MIDLRAFYVGILLVCGPPLALAQTTSPLANIDRELTTLCGRLPIASEADAPAVRSRLAALWRQRVALLAALPGERRTAAQQSSTASAQCLTLAKTAAEPRVAAPKSARKATSPMPEKRMYRNGGGGSGGAAPNREVLAERSAPAQNGGVSVPMARGPASVGPPIVVPPPVIGMTPPPTITAPSGPRAPSSTPQQPGGAADAPQLEEFFPWPPPAPSDRRLLELAQLGGDAPAANWGQVADRIMTLMRRAHYPSWGFYAAPGGFAVIPRIEQLDDQSGAALAGDARWASEVRLASTSVLSGILTVQRPQGLYRVIVFVLTNDPRSGGAVTDPQAMLRIARGWGVSGALDLPHALRARPVDPEQRLFALVYEFESAVGGATTVNSPGRWTMERHFSNAGIALQP